MSDDRAVQAAAAVMADDGWTCEYHDPSDPCSECDRARAHTATAIVSALRRIIEAEVRERIAVDIEAERDSVAAETENDRAYDIGMTDAARIARGTP